MTSRAAGPFMYSVKEPRKAVLKIRRSVFICTLEHAGTLGAAKEMIARVAKANKPATHNCWAYVIGDKGEVSHSSDAGEPAGSAGKPMLNMLKRYRITSAAAVVTRRFGGVKLGIPGLAEAYGRAVEASILQRPLTKQVKTVSVVIEVEYPFNDALLARLKPFQAEVVRSAYEKRAVHLCRFEETVAGAALDMLSAWRRRGRLAYRREGEDAGVVKKS